MANASRGHEVLLVDDEEIFLSSLFEGLCRRFPDMKFRTAHDGEAALDELGKHPVDLVITDLKMPRMDGFQLIAAMHTKYPRIPLLIMTAHSTELSVGKAMASGALHCIDKPVDLSELARRIDELFSTGAIATLRGVSLAAFLQLLGLERKSGIVDVQGQGTRSRLFLSSGQVIHADDGVHSGLEAALRTVALEDVEIQFRPGAVPKTPTIELSLTQLLLDAARMRDEGERNAASDLELAFSESFSDAFDERLAELETKDEPEPAASAAPALPASASVPVASAVSASVSAPAASTAGTAPVAVASPLTGTAPVAAASPLPGTAPVSASVGTSVGTSVAIPGSTPAAPSAAPVAVVPPAPAGAPARSTALPIPRARPSTAPPLRAATGGGPAAATTGVLPAQPTTTRMIGLRSSGGSAGSVTRPLTSVGSSAIQAPLASGSSHVPAAPRGASSNAAAPRTPLAGTVTAPISAPIGVPAEPAAPSASASTPATAATAAPPPAPPTPHATTANVSDAVASSLRKVAEISGVLGAAFVDFTSGEVLGAVTREREFDTMTMARGNVDVVRAEIALLESLGGRDAIEDIVITTREQYQVLCMNERRPRQFLFVAMSRDHATLALARFLIDEAVQSAGSSIATS